MKNRLAITQLASGIVVLCGLAFAQTSIAVSGNTLTVQRFGGYPISHDIASLWLSGPDRRPLVMIYFHGPDDWYRGVWNIDSKFEKGKPGWAMLQSENVTLHVEINPEAGEVTIQSRKFKVTESNTFLVLHTGELVVPQKVIPLGVFRLPQSNGALPPSLLFLRAHLELVVRIKKETRTGDRTSTPGKSSYSFTRPCMQKHVDFSSKTAGVENLFLTSRLIGPAKFLKSSYTLPCSPNSTSVASLH